VIALAILALVAAAAAAPLAGPWGAPLYAAFGWICHQQPERSWHLAGEPLAVCVRCLGLYLGALGGAVLRFGFSRRLLVATALLLAGDWAAESAGLLGPRPIARFLIGAAAGLALVSALVEPRRWRQRILSVKGAVSP